MYVQVCIQMHAYVIQVLFCVFKTHIVNMIQLILIKFQYFHVLPYQRSLLGFPTGVFNQPKF